MSLFCVDLSILKITGLVPSLQNLPFIMLQNPSGPFWSGINSWP